MQILLSLVLAAVFSVFGVVLLQIAQEVLQAQETTETPPAKWLTRKVALCGLIVSELSISLFLPWFYGSAPENAARILLALAILWPCAWSDAQQYMIPNRVLIFGAIAGAALLLVCVAMQPTQGQIILLRTLVAAGGVLVASLLCRLISPKAVGMGDIKLLAVLAIVLGMESVWGMLFCTFFAAFCLGIFLLISKRAKRSDSIPFAPLMLLGTIATAFLTGI